MTKYYKEDFYDEYAIKKEDTIIAIVDSGSNARKICDELNYLHRENQQLRWSIQVKNEILLKEVQINENYLDRIKHFEDTVKEAIKHEKTEMGQSVLKNLAANLGIDYV